MARVPDAPLDRLDLQVCICQWKGIRIRYIASVLLGDAEAQQSVDRSVLSTRPKGAPSLDGPEYEMPGHTTLAH